MGLPTRFIRESIKDSESAWPKANAKPSSGGRLLINDGKAAHKEALNLFLFSGFRFKANEQGYFDHDMSPVVTTTSRYAMFSCKPNRSEEHTSELQSLMRISYAVFCLKKKKQTT